MYVHARTGLVFLANPRTASRATAKALVEQAGFEMVGSHHSDGLPSIVGTTFCTVRNVLGTIRSWASKVGEHPEEPGDVWGKMEATNQFGIIEGWEPWTLFPHARYADRLLHYENLEPEPNALLEEYGLGPVKLERIP